MVEIKLYVFLTIFSFILTQQCAPGSNCPYNQGICVGNTCECLAGYKTLFNKDTPISKRINCNYKQINHFIPLILEFFLPGIGHFYVGKYWFGIIKLILAIASFYSVYYVFSEMRFPGFIYTFKKITTDTIYDGVCFCKTGINSIDICQKIFNITFYPLELFWLFDIFMYFFKVYNDGNGIPLV